MNLIEENLKSDACWHCGLENRNSGNFAQAIDDFSMAIKLKSDNALAYFSRGFTYHSLGNYPQAIDDYTMSIDLIPDFVDAFFNRGICYKDIGKYPQAIDDFGMAIELKSDFAEAYYGRGFIYQSLGNYPQAIDDFSMAIELKSDYAEAYLERGTIFGESENYLQAMDDFNKCIDLKPNFANAYFGRGLSHYELGNYPQAIDDFSIAIELNPDYVEAYFLRGHTNDYLLKNNVLIEGINIHKNNSYADYNTYLYLNIRNHKRIKEAFKLTSFYQIYPQAILTISKHAPIGTYISLNRIFEEAKQTIEDFSLLLRYYQLHIVDDHKRWGIEAVMLYHLGGSVESYKIFDEKLDDGVYCLTAQELYYFSLTALEINREKERIIQDGIDKINKIEEKHLIDFYYLGHLYLLQGDVENAQMSFAQNEDHVFSKIMITYLTGKDVDELENIDIHDISDFKTDIDYTAESLKQFQDYFHYKECLNAINIMDDEMFWSDSVLNQFNIPIWEIFSFSEAVRDEKSIITDKEKIIIALPKLESVAIKKEIIKKFEAKTDVGTKVNALRNAIKKDVKKLRQYKEYAELLELAQKDTDEDSEKNYNENLIASMIEEMGISAKDCMYFIYYYYLEKDISSEQAFDLILYLRHKINEENFTQIIREIENLGVMTIPGLENIKKGFNSLKNMGLAAYQLMYRDCLFDETQFSEYEIFKQSLWEIIPSLEGKLLKEVGE